MNKYLLDTNICIFAFRDLYGINERMLLCGKGQRADYGHRQFEALRPHRRYRTTKLGGTIICLYFLKNEVEWLSTSG